MRMTCLDSFCKSLKITWIRRYFDNSCSSQWKHLIKDLITDISYLAIYGVDFYRKFKKDVKNAFWIDVFSALSDLRLCIDNLTSVLSPVWYNQDICINSKSVCYRSWLKKGIQFVFDFYNTDGTVLGYHEFCTKFDLKTPFTLFFGVIDCIRKLHLNYDYDNIQRSQPFFPKFLQLITKSKQGGRDFYDVFINQKYRKPKSEIKWENILNLNVDNSWWKKQNILFFKITNDIQLRWFNYRIIHRILATNTFLCKIGITNTNLCSFCKIYPETLCHLFWECEFVENIWENALIWFKEQFGIDISLNKVDVLLGKYYKYYNIFNLIICIIKKHIYRSRSKNCKPSFERVKEEIVYYFHCEKHIYKKNGDMESFNKRWNLIMF